jgi:hypothetical protein
MKKLHLHVRSIYFDQIKAGTKTEEYRLANDYWKKRLFWGEGIPEKFDGIVIYNAYKPGDENQIALPWNGWEIKRIQHPHFGPDEVTVFAIKLA